MALLCSSRLSCDPRALTINSRCLHLASLKSTKTREKEFYMDQCCSTGWPIILRILINNRQFFSRGHWVSTIYMSWHSRSNWSESGWCLWKPSNCYVPANQWRREIEKDYNDPFHNCLPESYLLFPELQQSPTGCNFSPTFWARLHFPKRQWFLWNMKSPQTLILTEQVFEVIFFDGIVNRKVCKVNK